jgi:DNA-binding response OmpR family regulator
MPTISAAMTANPTHQPKVLLVDDDEELCVLLHEFLGRYGLTVLTAHHPDEAFRLFKSEPPDILVLDVMLPAMDGFTICRKVREQSRIPIVMLTARGDVADRVLGLELGADDYLPKPFEPRELVARIQAVLRRGNGSPPGERLRVGRLELDVDARTAVLDGRQLELTTAEFDLLALFVRQRGRALSRERILDEIHGLDVDSFDRSIDVAISRLRRKLGDDPKSPTFIKTLWGKGYCFVGGQRD